MNAATAKKPVKLSTILAGLDVRPSGSNKWMANCPVHDDSSPSLSVSVVEGDNGKSDILMHCFADCEIEDICDELDLTKADLFDIELDEPGVTPGKPSAARSPDNLTGELLDGVSGRLRSGRSGGGTKRAVQALSERVSLSNGDAEAWGIGFEDERILIPAKDVDGTVKGLRIRDPHPGAEVKERGLSNPDTGDACWLPYTYVSAAGKAHDALVVTEGPIDGLTVSVQGYDVFAVFGSNSAERPEVQRDLLRVAKGRLVIVCGDADKAGRKFADTIGRFLALNGVAVVIVEPPHDGWDLNDWYMSDRDAFASEFEDATYRQADVLDRTSSELKRFIHLPDPAWYDVLALWVMLCHLIRKPGTDDCMDTAPRVGFLSAVPGSGKTDTTKIIAKLIGADMDADPTPAVLVRVISATDYEDNDPDRPRTPVPIAIDEIDNIYNGNASDRGQFTTIMNAGYKRGTTLRRADSDNAKKIHKYEVFSAVVWNGLAKAKIPPALVTRSFIIDMVKATKKEAASLEKYFAFRHDATFRRLHDDCVNTVDSWSVEDIRSSIESAMEELSEVTINRELELWSGLLCVAKLMDSATGTTNWVSRFWTAFNALQGTGQARSETLSERFLRATHVVYKNNDRSGEGFNDRGIWSVELIRQVCEVDDTFGYLNHGREVNPSQVADYFKDFQVSSKGLKISGRNQNGYRWEDLIPLFDRYLSDVEVEEEDDPEVRINHPFDDE